MTTKKFWMRAEHMHISQHTSNNFNFEGFEDPEDLFDLFADDLYSLFESMKKPMGSVNDKCDYTAARPMYISAK